MLSAIADALSLQKKHQGEPIDKHQVEDLHEGTLLVLDALKNKSLSRKDIFTAIGKSSDYRAFKRYIQPLLRDGFIEMTVPDKPNSKLQKYRLTNKGKEAVRQEL